MSGLQRFALHFSFALSALTGIAYGGFKYFGAARDPYSSVGHPLQPWALAAHVVVSPLLIWAFGWIFSDHVLRKLAPPAGSASPAGRASGLASLWMLPPLILSGGFIQATTGETAHLIAVAVHVGSATALLLSYVVHALRSRFAGSGFPDFAALVARARRAGL